MKERPILFNGPMVRAIIEGRKTQTRRVVKPSWIAAADAAGESWGPEGDQNYWAGVCPHGLTGDRLWVRETYRFDGLDPKIAIRAQLMDEISYRADMIGDRSCDDCPWRPSIFMPRWASRITLEITAVSVERLQDISEADAMAEGCDEAHLEHTEECRDEHCALAGGVDDCCGYLISAKLQFKALWQSIHGPGSWDVNPWVWVLEFKRVEDGK